MGALSKTNFTQEIGYGEDRYSLQAAGLIKGKIENSAAFVYFVSGGTQANLIVLASLLKPFESVISPSTGHINTHEAGAVEATGHKIDSVENPDGKIKPPQIKEIVELHNDEHMVKPRVVFISNSTELGTIYKKRELTDLAKVCRQNNLYLFLDGARLGRP